MRFWLDKIRSTLRKISWKFLGEIPNDVIITLFCKLPPRFYWPLLICNHVLIDILGAVAYFDILFFQRRLWDWGGHIDTNHVVCYAGINSISRYIRNYIQIFIYIDTWLTWESSIPCLQCLPCLSDNNKKEKDAIGSAMKCCEF